ncbi:deformed epidermal autoregulatory factor 1-like [Onychostoma macrolepis]|uniref:deformed epidermal autoregulatory factor 1-like n=1 Tax=Onychostoma macrolepis TaxID=369639 RepID=UPI0027296C58|nr:deformed epidermal autoregulatory factor 1-like [Onychostoma macrolepis]
MDGKSSIDSGFGVKWKKSKVKQGGKRKIREQDGEKCVSCKGKWFTPRKFEKFGGKGNNKKWKSSIFYKSSNGRQQVQTEKLIQVTQTDRCDFTASKENNRRNNTEIPVCGSEEDTVTKGTIQQDNSSDESISVAERVKLNRREPINSTETVSETITKHIGSTGNDRDSPAHPTNATEAAVSPVIEEPDQTSNEAATEAAAQLNFSDSPAEWQNPVASEETEKAGQMQLFEFLENQFNTINNTLQSIDLSLKKLVEMQSQITLPQYISLTPAVIENPQIYSPVKEEQITEVVMT